MEIVFILVFAAGFFGLVGLIVLETDLCPHWVRRLLQPKLVSENEEQAKVTLRKTHSHTLKKLEKR